MRWLSLLFLSISVACITPLIAEAASDSRFFGHYCGNYEESYSVMVCGWLFPPICWYETRTATFSIDVEADYRESRRGNGLVTGKGTATGEGQTIPFVFSGVVIGQGQLRGSGIAPGREPTSAKATLSEDGNTVTLHALDRTLVLRKDRCGNDAPTVRITSPSEAYHDFPWGQSILFSGVATDREDASFPAERLVWTSSRDGRLGTGRLIVKNFLTPGEHTITFSGTDSGGRTASSSVAIQITNNQPNAPRIEHPAPGARFYAGQVIGFRARATDREDGYLSGDSLVWSSDLEGGELGTGDLLRRSLSRSGSHVITLAATDRSGLTTSTSVQIQIRPRPAGNTPPTVTVVAPANYYAFGDNTCVTFVAEASDLEDGTLSGSSIRWQDLYNDGTTRKVRELTPRGERIDICNFPTPIADTRHEIRAIATDSDGYESADHIIVIVIPGGLI